ncbi:MAG: carbamoyltransferase HypF [Elusimicrobia bacterium]|nr:carbamoyltransferase HypF [Elusimicrobiota bacterium]
MVDENAPGTMRRLWVLVRGAVQGVGFRPFVFRLASDLGLAGWVNNSAQGVTIEVEGTCRALESFLARLVREKPPPAIIEGLEHCYLDPAAYRGFEIRESARGGAKTAVVLPDIAPCPACLREIADPRDRRHRYPFTNCTHCGPRYTIIEELPYDRPGTTMRRFALCPACRREYEDPADRRFHAQPNACPACGPQAAWWDGRGKVLAERDDALREAAAALRRGSVVAVKGAGGFHLMTDARDPQAVMRLRRRKRREEKPFAVMFPSVASAREHARMSDLEERLLLSPEAPIVLLRRAAPASTAPLADSVAPGNPEIGAMLPSTPLHHLLLADLGFPVVATSGNLSEEPICTDERDALSRLGAIADFFLVHDRPIARHVDDSVVRVMAGRAMTLRRARGFAPLPVRLGRPLPAALCVGAHLKNAVAIAVQDGAHLSQHVGDLETVESYEAFQGVISSLSKLYDFKPDRVACDSHPDYVSTRHALSLGLPALRVQHHCGHVLSCMADNGLEGAVLGVAWDGTGYGPDGTVWGGEFLLVGEEGFVRAAHWRPFPLPGSEKAVREMRRSAFGLLYALFGGSLPAMEETGALRSFSPAGRGVLFGMCRRGVQAPLTSSVGRLFDAVSCLAGLRDAGAFEGQAAMELEHAADGFDTDERYPLAFAGEDPVVLDWEPMVRAILADLRGGGAAGLVSARFHNTLAESVVETARRLRQERVALSGGCFQNKRLAETTIARLAAGGFKPYWHQRVPPNDGGIALGQSLAAALGWSDASKPLERPPWRGSAAQED